MEWKLFFSPSPVKPVVLAMKMSVILIFIFCFQLNATGFSQRVTLSEKDAKLESIFSKIFEQTGIEFFYNSMMLEKARPVSINVKNEPIDKVLVLCFQGQPLEFELHDKAVIVKEKSIELIPKPLITITGIVTSEEDEPLEGVTIRVKNTVKWAITDEKGEFVLKNVADDAVLVVSSVGFNQVEINPFGKVRLNIRLKVAVKGLDETIVKGYYNTNKRFNTGSVAKVSSKEIEAQPISNVLTALEGRIPGLYVQQSSGLPGSAVILRLRGMNSIAAGNSPLIILDGVPIVSESMSKYLLGAGQIETSPLNNLNPADIASIEVLKDADGTAIYGSRGANGVILITTKKATIGKSNLNVNVYTGIEKVARLMPMLNTLQYLKVRHEAFANDNTVPGPFDYDINGTWDSLRYTDWQKELMGKTARVSDAQVSYSSGNAIIQMTLGLGYRREGIVVPGDFHDEKGSGHLRVSSTTTNKKVRIDFSASYVHNRNNLPQYNPVFLMTQPPNAPAIRDENGELNWENSTWVNPFAFLNQTHNSTTDNLITGLALNYQLLKGLYVKTTAGYSVIELKDMIKTPVTYYDPAWLDFVQNEANFSSNTIKNWIIEPQLTFTKAIGKSQIDILTGLTFQKTEQNVLAQTGTGFATEGLMDNIQAASAIQIIGSDIIKYAYNAAFSRLSYKYLDKYLVNLTARRDGSSRFGPGNQFANFGSVGVGWIFSNEKFVQKLFSFLSYGKLRGSYGTTGNDQIGDYNFLDSYRTGSMTYLGITPLVPQRINNPNYSWEINKKFELGIDLGFIDDKLLFSTSYYRNRSSNQLVGYSLPGTTGFTSVRANLPAVVQNSGLEFELSCQLLKRKKLSWSMNFNFTAPRNKLISYPNLSSSAYATQYKIGSSLFIKGKYHYTGIDKQTGVYTLEDVNQDGSYTTPQDLKFEKSVTQYYFGGLQNSFQFKQFEVDFFFQYVNQMGYNYLGYGLFEVPGTIFNQPEYVLAGWRPDNGGAKAQKYTASYTSNAANIYYKFRGSDASIDNASFIRLKNLSLTYNLSSDWVKKASLQTAKLFLQGQNLLTITKYEGLDPENQGQVPPLKIVIAGIRLTF